jgi:hypothetical protein
LDRAAPPGQHPLASSCGPIVAPVLRHGGKDPCGRSHGPPSVLPRKSKNGPILDWFLPQGALLHVPTGRAPRKAVSFRAKKRQKATKEAISFPGGSTMVRLETMTPRGIPANLNSGHRWSCLVIPSPGGFSGFWNMESEIRVLPWSLPTRSTPPPLLPMSCEPHPSESQPLGARDLSPTSLNCIAQ